MSFAAPKMIVVVIAILALSSAGAHPEQAEVHEESPREIARRAAEARDAAVARLIAVARDQEQSAEVRHEAILAMGEFRTDAVFDFLVDHIDYRSDIRGGFDGPGRERQYYPCQLVLVEMGDLRNLVVLQRLGRLRTPEQLRHTAQMLSLMGRGRAEQEVLWAVGGGYRGGYRSGEREPRFGENAMAIREMLR